MAVPENCDRLLSQELSITSFFFDHLTIYLLIYSLIVIWRITVATYTQVIHTQRDIKYCTNNCPHIEIWAVISSEGLS